jgi:hypothetical protein
MQISRRASALLAAAAIAAGVMSTATAAEASTPCTNAAGKYHGTLISTTGITGYDSEGNAQATGGTLRTYHSADCQTLWVRVDKLAKYTTSATDTYVEIDYYDVKQQKDVYYSKTVNTKGSLESKAVPVGAHGSAFVDGGFVADYQFVSGHTVQF